MQNLNLDLGLQRQALLCYMHHMAVLDKTGQDVVVPLQNQLNQLILKGNELLAQRWNNSTRDAPDRAALSTIELNLMGVRADIARIKHQLAEIDSQNQEVVTLHVGLVLASPEIEVNSVESAQKLREIRQEFGWNGKVLISPAITNANLRKDIMQALGDVNLI